MLCTKPTVVVKFSQITIEQITLFNIKIRTEKVFFMVDESYDFKSLFISWYTALAIKYRLLIHTMVLKVQRVLVTRKIVIEMIHQKLSC
jgi:hypothetical protein